MINNSSDILTEVFDFKNDKLQYIEKYEEKPLELSNTTFFVRLS